MLARIGDEELTSLLEGYGHSRCTGSTATSRRRCTPQMAEVLDRVVEEIAAIQRAARVEGAAERPRWPMIVLRTPKGWTGPKTVDGLPAEGTWRSHQVPMAEVRTNPEHLALLESWLRSYRPEELFDEQRSARPRARRAAAEELPADEREPARERRPAAPGPRPARLPRLRGRGRQAGDDVQPRRPASSATVPPRRDPAQPDAGSACSARTRRRRTGSSAVFEATDARLGRGDRPRRRPPLRRTAA